MFVMSSLATVSSGWTAESSAACRPVSTVAMTRWPRAASWTAASRPKPLPAPVIRTVFDMGFSFLCSCYGDVEHLYSAGVEWFEGVLRCRSSNRGYNWRVAGNANDTYWTVVAQSG